MKHSSACGFHRGFDCDCLAGVAVKARPAPDPVSHPAHYTQGNVECIDAIESALGRDGFIAFLRGQVLKYQWRLGHKDDPAQDAAKAHWYSGRLQKVLGDNAR